MVVHGLPLATRGHGLAIGSAFGDPGAQRRRSPEEDEEIFTTLCAEELARGQPRDALRRSRLLWGMDQTSCALGHAVPSRVMRPCVRHAIL